MLHLWEKLRGSARVELRGAEPERLLERCLREGLDLYQAERPEACTLRAALRQEDLPALERIAQGCGFSLELLSLSGGKQTGRLLRRRRVLLLSLLLMGAILAASQLFVWQFRVLGCEKLSRGQVLRALADCGVEPGTFAPGIRQELVRSRMLNLLPELEWMTVNVSGSRATVLVRERRETPGLRERRPADIAASRSGVIRSVTVLEGQTLVGPGDAVLEGETLVSGTMESLTQPPRQLRAMAEIRAETWRELIAVCPLEMLQLREPGASSRRFALVLGKNLFNLGKNQGKGLDECDKIVHEYTVGAEGLFSLPLRLRMEERRALLPTDAEARRTGEMEQALLRRLAEETDGEILETSFSAGRRDGLLIVTLQAHCLENIAQTKEFDP